MIMKDYWKIGNKLRITTIHESRWGDGPDVYIGEVIEIDKGLALRTELGDFKTQGTYWFGSILDQNIELLEGCEATINSWNELWREYANYIRGELHKPAPDYIFMDFLKEKYHLPIKK